MQIYRAGLERGGEDDGVDVLCCRSGLVHSSDEQ